MAARFRRTPGSPAHRTWRWRRLPRRFRAAWVAERGWVCAGFRRAPHAATELATDHIVPVSEDPALAFTWANLQCLCPSCNGRKSLSQRAR